MRFILCLLLFIPIISLSQTKFIDSLKKEVQNKDLTKDKYIYLNLRLASKLNSIRNKDAYYYALVAKNESKKIDSLNYYFNSLLEIAYYHGNYGEKDSILPIYKDVEKYALSSGNKRMLMRTYAMFTSHYITSKSPEKAIEYGIKNIELAKSPEEKFQTQQGLANIYITINNYKDACKYASLAYEEAKKINDSRRLTHILGVLGKCNMYQENIKEAEEYFNKAIGIGLKSKNLKQTAYAYIDLGELTINYKKDTIKGISLFKRSQNIAINLGDRRLISAVDISLGNIYMETGIHHEGLKLLKTSFYDSEKRDDYDSALKTSSIIQKYYEGKKSDSALVWYKKNQFFKDTLNTISKQEKFKEIETRYNVSEKEKQNLLLQSEIEKEKREQHNLWIGVIIIFIIGIVFSFLLYKNTKRKQRIAEQEREIEIKIKEKILKEQELNAIDAMIDGQEKERQRLACDLHDNVGATLSAARLQFEHLQKHKGSLPNEEELFTKTGELLEEAYQEVRSIAHIKNSGVLAKLGLLPAIEKLAKNVSVSKLHVEVIDFGLNERISNTLEITIFRIIQELVTNIIKHANATEASISLTQIENTLNIIVEDNGMGFNTRETSLNTDGMGIGNIEKRIEYLEGTLEVDSSPGKGTNILIDIPI